MIDPKSPPSALPAPQNGHAEAPAVPVEQPAPPPRSVTLEELRAEYPGWAISQSGTGGYWANLFGDPTPAQQKAGAVAFISADTLELLDDELERQDKIRRSNP